MEKEKVSKKYFITLLAISLCALIIRLIVIHSLAALDIRALTPPSTVDMATYYNYAIEIINGTYKGVFYYQPFYYVAFLPLIFKFISQNIFAALYVQAILGAVTVFIAAECARNFFDKKAGIITAVFIAFSCTLSFYTSYLLIVTLQTFFIVMILYLAIQGYKRKSLIYLLIMSLILGCAIATRGNMWLILPPITIFFFLVFGYSKGKFNLLNSLKPIPIIIIFTLIPVIPFIYYNTSVTGKFTGPSTASDAVLVFGNTPESPPCGITKYSETAQYWLDHKKEMSIPKRIVNFITTSPLQYTELTFRKLMLYLSHEELPNNANINNMRQLSKPLTFLSFIPVSIYLFFGFASLIFLIPEMLKKRRSLWLIFIMLILYWLSISLFNILARFRAPSIPLLAIYSGCAISYLLTDKTYLKRKLIIFVILLGYFFFIVYYFFAFYRTNIEKRIMRIITPNGTISQLGKTRMVLDNGPMPYGSWTTIPLNSNMIVEKLFYLPPQSANDVKIKIPLFYQTKGSAILNINGEDVVLTAPNSGIINLIHTVNIKNFEDKNFKILISLKRANTRIFLIADQQRDYGRTLINNTVIPGELVAKAYFTEKE